MIEAQSKNLNTDLEIVQLRNKETDYKVMVMVKKMQNSGAVFNYSIIIAVATEIIMINDMILLKGNIGKTEL